MDVDLKGVNHMGTMIPVEITVRQRYQDWYIAACGVDLGNGITRLVPPTRRFISQTAAVNFAKRMVLCHLKCQGRPVLGTDLDCEVKSLTLDTAA
jgi:hypothetical protein